jgi:hypothetical protein
MFVPVFIAWKCYPNKRGLAISLVQGANGVGTIASNIISTYLVNRTNQKPDIVVVT